MPQTYNIEIPDVGYFERQVSCRVGCPVHTDAGGYVQAIAQGRYEDAYIIARQPNPFASICGRVCVFEGEGGSVCTQQKVFAQITSKVPTTLHFLLPNFDSGTSSEI